MRKQEAVVGEDMHGLLRKGFSKTIFKEINVSSKKGCFLSCNLFIASIQMIGFLYDSRNGACCVGLHNCLHE